jgi:hypothetical protein
MSNSQEDLTNMQSVIDAEEAVENKTKVLPTTPPAPELIDLEAPAVTLSPVVEKTNETTGGDEAPMVLNMPVPAPPVDAIVQVEKPLTIAEKRALKQAERIENAKAAHAAFKQKLELKANTHERETRNDVRHPNPNSVGANVWGILHELSATKGSPVTVNEAILSGTMDEIHPGTIISYFHKWKKFYGYVATPTAK